MTDFEKLMTDIGDFGVYQWYSIALLQFCFLAISPSYQMGSVFYAIKVCSSPKYSQISYLAAFYMSSKPKRKLHPYRY